jgi:hypothetical protein
VPGPRTALHPAAVRARIGPERVQVEKAVLDLAFLNLEYMFSAKDMLLDGDRHSRGLAI